MNNLADVCLVGLRVRGNYVRCLVITVISMELGGAKKCEGGFKVISSRGKERGKATKMGTVGEVDSCACHEEGSHYKILVF